MAKPSAKKKDPSADVELALSIGEPVWAIRCANEAIKAALKESPKRHHAALRRHAEIHLATSDDSDLPSAAVAAKAWQKVTLHELATADDFEELSWAELLAFKPKNAKAALEETQARSPKRPRNVLEAAVHWATRRKDEKRLDALVAAATEAEVSRLEFAVRLLVQADVCPLALADRLVAHGGVVWDPVFARRLSLRVYAYRGAEQRDRAKEILDEWVRACEAALPDANDLRRHVLDAEGPAEEKLARMERRVLRVSERFGAESPALRMPLMALAYEARNAGVHAVAASALQKLDPIMAARGSSQDALLDRHLALGDWRKSLTELRRFDEAWKVLAIEEGVKAKRSLHMVPDHYARATIYEAEGNWDRVVEEHLARVAQYEAGEPPVYGPGASNTEHARFHARLAMERAGRGEEAKKRFPEKAR